MENIYSIMKNEKIITEGNKDLGLTNAKENFVKNMDSLTKKCYCVVIPFDNFERFKEAIKPIKKTRLQLNNELETRLQPNNEFFIEDWFVSGVIMTQKEFMKYAKKFEDEIFLNALIDGEY
jgi:hypothetical protein